MSKNQFCLLTAAFFLMLTLGRGRASAAPDNPLAATGDSFAGSYAGDQLSLTFNASDDGSYTGQVKRGDQTFPIKAHQDGAKMHGTFSAGADAFEFTAELNGEQLSFSTGTAHYMLNRVGRSANPLDASAPANPPEAKPAEPAPAAVSPESLPAAASAAAPLPNVPLPKGFSELGSTPSGRSIFSNFSDVKSIDDLIQHVGDAIGAMFGTKPQFGSAAVDAKNKNGGIATFTATLKGLPIKGIVLFGMNPQGTSSATVIYTRPNTPHDEFMALMQTAPAQPKMHTVQMPDNSGSIDIPEGWTCKSQSMTAGPIFVQGPKDQGLLINGRIFMYTPESVAVRTATGAHDSAVRVYNLTHGRGIPPQPLESYLKFFNIAPYNSPEEAFTHILPKLNDQQRQAGKTWPEFGPITFKQNVPPMIAGDEAEIIGSTLTWHTGDKTSPVRRLMMKVETSKPVPSGVWTIFVDQYVAPVETAAADFPLMMQIYTSINIPQAAVQRQLDKDNKAFQSMCAYFQAKNEALLERGRQFQINQKEQFQRFEQQQAAQAQARHDACSDMIESTLGVRDVLDTATGQMHKVDLYNSTGITETLNGLANDPNRFVQIPLRYER